MRLHVVSLPHTQTTRAYDHCAYTAKVRKFATMMHARGHEVFLYAGEHNEANCTEHITCFTVQEQWEHFGQYDWFRDGAIYSVAWDPELPYWRQFNTNVISELSQRLERQDFICLITGHSAQSIPAAFPTHQCVEFGIGYEGIMPDTKHIFESYAWMHALYGLQRPSLVDGHFFDAVIPNYYDTAEFPGPVEPEDYFLFMSRMIWRKGYQIAIHACELIGAPLKIAGIGGDRPVYPHIEYVGLADTQTRGELLSRARATFVPTIYLEPFGGVAAESLLCGTPVICTDWGGFTEYVEHGIDGYRCRTMAEFADACRAVDQLDRAQIRERAQARFSAETVGAAYERHFERLLTLWGAGFYAGCG